MNAMQGSFYSTAFRVRDEQAFATAPAIHGLLEDTSSNVVMEDPLGWIGVLQAHLQPDSGIVIVDETAGDQKFFTYIAPDRVGWTRRAG